MDEPKTDLPASEIDRPWMRGEFDGKVLEIEEAGVFLAHLIRGCTLEEAAKLAKISKAKATRFLRDPKYQQILREKRDWAIERAGHKLLESFDRCFKRLEDIVNDGGQEVAVKAAKVLLDKLLQIHPSPGQREITKPKESLTVEAKEVYVDLSCLTFDAFQKLIEEARVKHEPVRLIDQVPLSSNGQAMDSKACDPSLSLSQAEAIEDPGVDDGSEPMLAHDHEDPPGVGMGQASGVEIAVTHPHFPKSQESGFPKSTKSGITHPHFSNSEKSGFANSEKTRSAESEKTGSSFPAGAPSPPKSRYYHLREHPEDHGHGPSKGTVYRKKVLERKRRKLIREIYREAREEKEKRDGNPEKKQP